MLTYHIYTTTVWTGIYVIIYVISSKQFTSKLKSMALSQGRKSTTEHFVQ